MMRWSNFMGLLPSVFRPHIISTLTLSQQRLVDILFRFDPAKDFFECININLTVEDPLQGRSNRRWGRSFDIPASFHYNSMLLVMFRIILIPLCKWDVILGCKRVRMKVWYHPGGLWFTMLLSIVEILYHNRLREVLSREPLVEQ